MWIGRLFDCAVMHETKRSLHIRLQRVQPGSFPGAIAGAGAATVADFLS